MNEQDLPSTPDESADEAPAADPQRPWNPGDGTQPGWAAAPPQYPVQPPDPPAPWGVQAPSGQQPGPGYGAQDPSGQQAGPGYGARAQGSPAEAGSEPWARPTYQPGPPPYGAGAVPPYGAWGYGPSGGDPWGPRPDQAQPNRAARRSRRGRAAAAGAAAGFLVVAGAGVVIGHATWPATTHASASAPVSPSTGTGSTGTGSTGTGSTGTGSTGTGSSGFGTGSTGSSSTGSGSTGSGSTGTGGFGSGGFGSGSGSTSSAASSSIASGGPSNSADIASGADAGLVDIDTTLGYEDAAAAGTGMVLTSTGEILTNNHVIDGATSVRVTDIGNGKTYTATVVGYDRTQDVAVLQLQHASGLKTVTLGNSSAVTTSQAVVGVGNAGGVGGTPTYAGGVIEGLGKSITATDEGGGNSEHLTGLFETNAGIEAGDSGGPLLDTAGQVVGMDTAALAGTQFQAATTTTSYAIPINEATAIARQIESGRGTSVVHIGSTALLGVEIDAAATGGSSALGGEEGSGDSSSVAGAAIADVVSGSAAAKAGLVEGDTITAVNGHSVASASALTNDLTNDRPGQTVSITYVTSSGQRSTVSVQLSSGPPQ